MLLCCMYAMGMGLLLIAWWNPRLIGIGARLGSFECSATRR